jgi:N,N'-diacetyllegionaminate synthase
MKKKYLKIAEIGMTHDGSFGLAKQLTKAAISSGANVVKYQCHIPEFETTRNAPAPHYFKDENRFEYFERTKFSYNQFKDLHLLCNELGVYSCISPFSIEAAEMCIDIGFDYIKIASGEVTNMPLIDFLSSKKDLRIIMSSGMSSLDEISNSLKKLKNHKEFYLLQCSSIYPCPPEKSGLNFIRFFEEKFKVNVGISDHTTTDATSIAAAALGACVVEKHFTLSKDLYGPDASFSLDSNEFFKLCTSLDYVWSAIKVTNKNKDINTFKTMKKTFEKSIYAKKDIDIGEKITIDNISFLKPLSKIHSSDYKKILSRKVSKKIKEGQPVDWKHFK